LLTFLSDKLDVFRAVSRYDNRRALYYTLEL
jgi:hypothetical protein